MLFLRARMAIYQILLIIFSHLCERNSSGVGVHVAVHTLYFFSETAAWNHFTLYMDISLV